MKTLLLLAGLLASLATAAQPRKYYVSALTGSDQNPGTLARPLATIQQAADGVLPGDTVFVRGGTYTNRCSVCPIVTVYRSGTPSQWIVFKNYPGELPLLKFDAWGGFRVQVGAAYIEISGFRIQGATASQRLADAQVQNSSCDDNGNVRPGDIEARYNGGGIYVDGVNPAPTPSLPRPHHLRLRNNEIFECGGTGIGSQAADYLTIENNLLYNNCWHTLFGGSAISLYQSWNYDLAPGYHMVVRGNRCFGNRLFVKWFQGCAVTDGNGIIIDDSKHTQNGSTLGPYQGRTLVANNLLVGNGGTGVHAYESEHVDIVNNTAYHNSQSVEIDNGEIFAGASNDVLIQNNILVPLPGNVVNIDFSNTNVATRYNLHFGGTTAAVPGTATVRADPRFVNATLDWRTADFRLQAGSPAQDVGLAAGAPATDFDGRPRPQGAGVDLGAFEYAGPGTPAPGFGGTYRLLARHSGQALDVSDASPVDGARAIQWPVNGGVNQYWKIEATSDGYYTLTAQHSGKCLDVSGVSVDNGALVQQWAYGGGANQQWAIEPTSDGYYKLTARHSDKCLDVGGSAEGAGVQQWRYGGGANQQWKLESVVPARARANALPTATGAALQETGLWTYPNPSRSGDPAAAAFSAARPQSVSVVVHNQFGQLVRTLSVAAKAGPNDVALPPLAPGLYLLRATIDGQPRHATLQVQ